jgi:hypothetical protein
MISSVRRAFLRGFVRTFSTSAYRVVTGMVSLDARLVAARFRIRPDTACSEISTKLMV